MAIIETLNTNQITDALWNDKENNGFSYEACKALVNYYEDLSDDTGEVIELDVVAWRCAFTEYDDEELISQYKDCAGYDELVEVIEFLQDNTAIIKACSNTWLVQEF